MSQTSWSEYRPGQSFPGVIGRTTDESSPAWPQPVRAVPGSPNVLFVVPDDTGFGQFGCYGSPIETPNLDALAAGGLLYTDMHTTALCSPSRSCIVTGRNHHANGMAAITEAATGYPGYNGQIPFENGFLSEMLLHTAATRTWSGSGTWCPRSTSPRRVLTTGGRRVGLRAVLRLPGRGLQSGVSGPGVRQPPGRAAVDAGGGLPPDRGPGRAGDVVHLAHIIDMVPTVLDVLGVEPPASIRGVTQSPLHGVIFARTFDDPAAPTRHRTQYYGMLGHRAIDHDGWRAVCP